MDGGEDWLMRPVLRGMVSYDALLSTDYDLEDFLLMNEAMDVELENQLRCRPARQGG